jgi:hypothetical protein
MLIPSKRILSITAAGCDCYLAAASKLVLEARFAPGEGEEFAAFAKSRRSSVFSVLSDQIEEDFRQDTLPFLRGSARTQLLERKTGQIYRDSPYHTIATLGRQTDGRRDERVQLLGLTNAEGLNEWLTPLSAAGVRVAGVYSPPVVSRDLLRHLKSRTGTPPKRMLLVSVNRAGLRQTLVEGEVPRFSRLAAVAREEGDDFAAACLAEVNKTQQYLVGLRLLPREETLPTLILVPPGEEANWSRHGLLVDAVDAIFLDVAVARRTAGLRRVTSAGDTGNVIEEDAQFADTLWVHTVARAQPRLNFAPAWLVEKYMLWQARVAIWAAGALVLLAGIGWGLERLAQSEKLLGESARLRDGTERNDINYERTKRGFPPLPATPEHLKASVTSFEKINARAIVPGALLAEVGQALERAGDFRLLRLDWRQGDSDPAEAGNKASPAAPQPGNVPPQRFEWVTLYGMAGKNPETVDARLNTEIALRTAEILRSVRGSSVSIVRAPVDLTPGGRIAGSALSEASASRTAIDSSGNVEILVARRAGP